MLVPLFLAAALVPPPELPEALAAAIDRPGVRAELLDYRPSLPPGCRVTKARVRGNLSGSGAATVDLDGEDARGAKCAGWALVRVRLHARVPVTARPVAAGERLAPAATLEERELSGGEPPISSLPEDAVAAWPLPEGTPLTSARIRRAGPRPGASIPVVVSGGGLTVEAYGTLVACSGDRDCALLPSGKRLAGTLQGGKLIVEVP